MACTVTVGDLCTSTSASVPPVAVARGFSDNGPNIDHPELARDLDARANNRDQTIVGLRRMAFSVIARHPAR
jgi:hypothetical protein